MDITQYILINHQGTKAYSGHLTWTLLVCLQCVHHLWASIGKWIILYSKVLTKFLLFVLIPSLLLDNLRTMHKRDKIFSTIVVCIRSSDTLVIQRQWIDKLNKISHKIFEDFKMSIIVVIHSDLPAICNISGLLQVP